MNRMNRKSMIAQRRMDSYQGNAYKGPHRGHVVKAVSLYETAEQALSTREIVAQIKARVAVRLARS
jgi:hypothetical protein